MARARSATRSGLGSSALGRLGLLVLGLVLAAVALYGLLGPAADEEIDDVSRGRLERVLREAERAAPEGR